MGQFTLPYVNHSGSAQASTGWLQTPAPNIRRQSHWPLNNGYDPAHPSLTRASTTPMRQPAGPEPTVTYGNSNLFDTCQYFINNRLGSLNRSYTVHGCTQHPSLSMPLLTPTLSAEQSSSSWQDDDPDNPEDSWDSEMDDVYTPMIASQQTDHGLTTMLARNTSRKWMQHSADTFAGSPTMLASYRPTLPLSPLHDEKAQDIFRHFVVITGPCMSIFERKPSDLTSHPPRTLWSFTMPSLSIAHPALSHAILAMGALHLAKLRHTSEDLAAKHSRYAQRRVTKLLDVPQRRHEIATLAVVLLLGYYEVVAADHSKWNLHLQGAMGLILEHDYAGPTRITRLMRANAKVNLANAGWYDHQNYVQIAGIPLSLLDDKEWEVNETLVSQLTGFDVPYDNQHHTNRTRGTSFDVMTEKEVEEYKVKLDLRWWYCKQDVFQSMVSGDPLLMPFDQWIYCPPRGQIGRADVAYATLDYLLLIMARLTDFGGKDRIRKQRVIAAQGGQWTPPPGLFGPDMPPGPTAESPNSRFHHASHSGTRKSATPVARAVPAGPGPGLRTFDKTNKPATTPSANEGRPRQAKPSTAGPDFHGMMPPPTEPIRMSAAFHDMSARLKDKAFATTSAEQPTSPSHETPRSLEEETAAALVEHASICLAFDTFEASLGPDFQPITLDVPINTPFGPALRFRKHSIACIWMLYWVGRILLHRLHPHMPPAAMVSVGVTAHKTHDYAQAVGRICGGLYSYSNLTLHSNQVDPEWAGALLDSSFCVLFAAVQYQDASQREWTISKLQTIARIVGWQTMTSIAGACEAAWEKMGLVGRGPPYVRTLDKNHKDSRVNGSSRWQESERKRDANPQASAVEDTEGRFVKHDRNLIDRHASTRVHWALGLLSVEEDINKMKLED